MKEIINIIDNLEDESEQDKKQIKRALKCTKYELHKDGEKTSNVSRKKAIELLGNEIFVSGLERSAFHYTAFRTNNDIGILFDSSDLFEEV